jgi:hypothetical protein
MKNTPAMNFILPLAMLAAAFVILLLTLYPYYQ